MTVFIIGLTLTYIILIGAFIIGFFRIKEFKLKKTPPSNTFTIIIPFRNEAQNLPELLNSLSKLKYPKELFEILLINDESEDDFMSIISNYNANNLRVINNERNSNSPKKNAIETGIRHSNFDWILTTDADCILPEYWVNSYDEFIQMNAPVFIAGPVTFKINNTFLDKFQLLDFMALIGCSIGGFGILKPFMCNGANLCYKKDAFIAVNGFEGNKNIASGDDIFLLEKMIKKYPKQTKYLKSLDTLVVTSTMSTIRDLFSQRIRWASKTNSYTNSFTKFISLTIFLINLLCAVIITKSIIYQTISSFSILILSLKVGIDFIIILITLKFMKKSTEIIFFPIISIFHPFFNLAVAILTLIRRKYNWKNRDINING